MRRMGNLLAAGAASVLLSGCASIVTGTTQTIVIASKPPGVICEVRHNNTVIASGSTPLSFAVDKSMQDLGLVCTDSYSRQVSGLIYSDFNAWVIGNVVFGGLIGVTIDFITGAVSKYSSSVLVVFNPPPVQIPQGAPGQLRLAPAGKPRV